MEETNLCKACYGKKQYSVYTGYTRSWDFPWDEWGRIDRQETRTCPRCNGTGEEPGRKKCSVCWLNVRPFDGVPFNGKFYCTDCISGPKKEEQKPEFVRGEEVEVSDSLTDTKPLKRIYIATMDTFPLPHLCVRYSSEKDFLEWKPYKVDNRKYIRKLPKQEAWPKRFTKEQVAEFITRVRSDEGTDRISEWELELMGNWILGFLKKHGMLEE